MIVVDASSVLEILEQTETGVRLGDALANTTIDAPHLIDLEVANVLRRWTRNGKMTESDAVRALEAFAAMPIRRHPHQHLLSEIWRLRHNLTAYDGAYLALAWSLDAELITMDEGLRKRAKRR